MAPMTCSCSCTVCVRAWTSPSRYGISPAQDRDVPEIRIEVVIPGSTANVECASAVAVDRYRRHDADEDLLERVLRSRCTGVKDSGCGDSNEISGEGSHQNEELVLTFSTPVPLATLVLGLNKVNFASDEPVIFVQGTDQLHYTLSEADLLPAYQALDADTGVIEFSAVADVPLDLPVHSLAIRETADHLYVHSLTFGCGCAADFDGSGSINSADLAMLLGNWGPGAPPAIDLNGDGTVNSADLAFLLGSWGPCD